MSKERTKIMSIRVTDDMTDSIKIVSALFGATKGDGAINKSGGIIAAVRFAEYVATQPGGEDLIRAFKISEIGL